MHLCSICNFLPFFFFVFFHTIRPNFSCKGQQTTVKVGFFFRRHYLWCSSYPQILVQNPCPRFFFSKKLVLNFTAHFLNRYVYCLLIGKKKNQTKKKLRNLHTVIKNWSTYSSKFANSDFEHL